ncbi:MAG: AbrB/MazE/SpoVT family DNA-binding domain-containing protein [Acidobacteria bacterium]|nr:MAG: AbrB/MazE/SpoVT family DNA-binding domain-containing protein [Acidobacteriota bacterium]
MKVDRRGRITIPKRIREQFGFGPQHPLDLQLMGDAIVLTNLRQNLGFADWKGRRARSFARLGYSSVDEFIEAVRGR